MSGGEGLGEAGVAAFFEAEHFAQDGGELGGDVLGFVVGGESNLGSGLARVEPGEDAAVIDLVGSLEDLIEGFTEPLLEAELSSPVSNGGDVGLDGEPEDHAVVAAVGAFVEGNGMVASGDVEDDVLLGVDEDFDFVEKAFAIDAIEFFGGFYELFCPFSFGGQVGRL